MLAPIEKNVPIPVRADYASISNQLRAMEVGDCIVIQCKSRNVNWHATARRLNMRVSYRTTGNENEYRVWRVA